MGGKPDAFFQHASAQCKVGGGIGGVIVCPPNKLVEQILPLGVNTWHPEAVP